MTGPEGAPGPPEVTRPGAATRVPSPLMARFAASLAVAPANRKSAKIQAFWAHAAARGTPLTEPATSIGQQIVTFLWRCPADDDSDAVYLLVSRPTDEREVTHSLMLRVVGTDIWHLSYQLDADWRASYCFYPMGAAEADRALATDQIDVRRWLDAGLPDPLNPDRASHQRGRQMSIVRAGVPPPP